MKKIYNVAKALANNTENNRFSFPSSMGKGYIQNICLKSGIQLTTADYTLKYPMSIKLEPPFKPIGFGFWLSN